MKLPSLPKSLSPSDAISVASFLVALFSLVCSASLGLRQARLAERQAELEAIFTPVNYVIEEDEDSFLYSFGDTKIELPYPKIRFTTGRPREFSVLTVQDGAYSVASAALSPTEEYSIGAIKTGMPISVVDPEAQYVYDYFFVYYKDAAGNAALDMVYYQIDIFSGSVNGPIICSELERLENVHDDPYKKEMLAQYSRLIEELASLPHLAQ